MKRAAVEVQMDKDVMDEEIMDTLADESTSKSQKMKDLFDIGLPVKEIAQLMDVRYNFVYNVISNYAAMNGIEVTSTQKAGKSDRIIELHVAGKSNKEIAIELKTNYNYVFNVVKKWKLENPDTEAMIQDLKKRKSTAVTRKAVHEVAKEVETMEVLYGPKTRQQWEAEQKKLEPVQQPEEPKTEVVVEEPKAEEPAVEEPKVEEPKAEEPKEEPKPEEKKEEPKAEDKKEDKKPVNKAGK